MSPIERAARAIHEAEAWSSFFSLDDARVLARAAIEAHEGCLAEQDLVIVPRKPSPPMQAAGSGALGIEGLNSVTSYGAAGRAWAAMIDALLNAEPNEEISDA